MNQLSVVTHLRSERSYVTAVISGIVIVVFGKFCETINTPKEWSLF